MTERPVIDDDVDHVQLSSRDTSQLPTVLADWLTPHLGTRPLVTVDSGVDANGLSSETIILTLAWTLDAGAAVEQKFVMRVAPTPEDLPMMPRYRLDEQFELMRQVAASTDIPVPAVRWLEPTGTVIGTPFFLMDYVDGVVPPDVLPYTFGGNWFADASADDRRRLQDSTVEVLAALHSIPDPSRNFGFLTADRPDASPLRRRVDELKTWYAYATTGLGPVALLDRALAWLEDNWPAESDSAASVLCWGDARIGNVMYDDFQPVAVLDWEIATLGPRELDLSWFIYAHTVWQEVAHLGGLPGLPDVLREEDVLAAYRDATGVQIGDLRWFYVLSAVLWGIFMVQGARRRIHFGEMERPADIESFVYHANSLKQLIGEA